MLKILLPVTQSCSNTPSILNLILVINDEINGPRDKELMIVPWPSITGAL